MQEDMFLGTQQRSFHHRILINYSLFIITIILEPHAVLVPNVDVEVDGEELDFICDNI